MTMQTLLAEAAELVMDSDWNPEVNTYTRHPKAGGATNNIVGEFSLDKIGGQDKHTTEGRKQEFEATFTTATSTVLEEYDKIERASGELWSVVGPVQDDGRLIVWGLMRVKRTTVTHVGNKI